MTPPDALTALVAIARTTLALALAAVVVQVVLRLIRPQSPRVHRAAWVCVLAIGWLWLRLPVAIPFYQNAVPAAKTASEAAAGRGTASQPQPAAGRRSPEPGEDLGSVARLKAKRRAWGIALRRNHVLRASGRGSRPVGSRGGLAGPRRAAGGCR